MQELWIGGAGSREVRLGIEGEMIQVIRSRYVAISAIIFGALGLFLAGMVFASQLNVSATPDQPVVIEGVTPEADEVTADEATADEPQTDNLPTTQTVVIENNTNEPRSS